MAGKEETINAITRATSQMEQWAFPHKDKVCSFNLLNVSSVRETVISTESTT